MNMFKGILAVVAGILCASAAHSQSVSAVAAANPDSVIVAEGAAALADTVAAEPYEPRIVIKAMPKTFFLPAVFKGYEFEDTVSPFAPEYSGKPEMRWLEEERAQQRTIGRVQRYLFYNHPDLVPYNINLLPEAPKMYHAVLNPEDHTIEIVEAPVNAPVAPTIAVAEVKRRHWIRKFDASLQFSQAYVSPNWYQGGNNNLNMLANIYYNVKLNPEYHPKYLFETTFQYKLGMNNAPDDTVHSYSISDDLFQINSTFGIKAAKNWYYSLTGMFKTQLLNSYNSNSHQLRSAFLSPSELNLGLGMTYNYANPKGSFTLDASLAPLSYNIRTCTNRHIDPTLYSIDSGRRAKHSVGSSAEVKVMWKIAYNIIYTSRLFGFTNYDSGQADWENKVAFEINRFLTTQVFVHLRYDSQTPKCNSEHWKKLQCKEILSLGFAYKFSSI